MTIASSQSALVGKRDRDTYRFGDGARPVLQPGTVGWCADDLEDETVRSLWDAGRHEIVEGVLTVMPAARFRGGSVLENLIFLLRPHFLARAIPVEYATEVDIAATPMRVLRADGVAVIGADLDCFAGLTFDSPGMNWRDYPLTLPPTLVIESVSLGHEAYDRRTKRAWYAEFGVPHYWIIDGYARSIECLRLNGQAYVDDAVGRQNEIVRPSAFPGLALPLAEVFPP